MFDVYHQLLEASPILPMHHVPFPRQNIQYAGANGVLNRLDVSCAKAGLFNRALSRLCKAGGDQYPGVHVKEVDFLMQCTAVVAASASLLHG